MNEVKLNDKQLELIEKNNWDIDAVIAYLEVIGDYDDNLDSFAEAYQGQYDNDESFAVEMAEMIGAIDKDAKWPQNCIDWEQAADELMYDYTEQDGYYFRNL